MRKTLNADPLDSSTGNDISPSVKAPEKHIDCCPWRRTLFALSGRDANSNHFLAAYVRILVFWYPDAFCLMQERLYRSLYEKVRSQTEDEIDFSMNAAADEFQTKKTTIPNRFLSKTILRFCLPPAIVTAGIIYICSALCASAHECSPHLQRWGLSDCQRTRFFETNVGASIARPPKNRVFRIYRREIALFFALRRQILRYKICGRPMVAPTSGFLTHWQPPSSAMGAVFYAVFSTLSATYHSYCCRTGA